MLIRYCKQVLAYRCSNASSLRIAIENAIAPLLPHGKARLDAVAQAQPARQRPAAHAKCAAPRAAARSVQAAKRQTHSATRSIRSISNGKIPAARLGRRPERRHRTGSPRRFVADALCGGCDVPKDRACALISRDFGLLVARDAPDCLIERTS